MGATKNEKEFIKELACRSLVNFYLIKERRSNNKENNYSNKKTILESTMREKEYDVEECYEVTQLLNSLICMIVFPKERYESQFSELYGKKDTKDFPMLDNALFHYTGEDEYFCNSGQKYNPYSILRHIKNGLSHSLVSYRTEQVNGKNIISHIHFEDRLNGSNNFKITLSINELEDFVIKIYNDLMSFEEMEDTEESDNTNITELINSKKIVSIPTYETPVSAGNGNFIEEERPEKGYYRSTKISSKASYCVKISGDSMEPEYHDGEYVFVKKAKLNNGELGIFLYDDEVFFKKYKEKDGKILLVSLNKNYPDKEVIIFDKFKVLGKVIGKYYID